MPNNPVPIHHAKVPALTDASPVIFVPGICGSRLERGGETLWKTRDVVKTLQLLGNYNEIDHTVHGDAPVVVSQVENGELADYYSEALREALKDTGFADAPYEWRFTPQDNSVDEWIELVKTRVEALYSKYNNKKVVILSHSMGNLMTMCLFHKEPEWAKQYLAKYCAVAPPFGGAGYALLAFLPIHIEMKALGLHPYVVGVDFHGLNFPSISWMLPYGDTFKDAIVANVDGVEYTANQIRKFLEDLPKIKGSYPLEIFDNIVADKREKILRKEPPIPTWLFYSRGNTPTPIGFKKIGYNLEPIMDIGENYGDGVVPYASLLANSSWPDLRKEDLTGATNPDINHGNIIDHPVFLTRIAEILAEKSA